MVFITVAEVLDRSPGQDRTSFSTSCLPMKPVAPVTKTDLPLKNSPMALVSMLADIVVRSEESQREKFLQGNELFSSVFGTDAFDQNID